MKIKTRVAREDAGVCAGILILISLATAVARADDAAAMIQGRSSSIGVSRGVSLIAKGRQPAVEARRNLLLYGIVTSQSATPGRSRAVGTVVLNYPSASSTNVTLRSENDRIATVPIKVVVPAGSLSVSFRIKTHAVVGDPVVALTASIGGEKTSCLFRVGAPTTVSRTFAIANIANGARIRGEVPIRAKAGIAKASAALVSLYLDGTGIGERNPGEESGKSVADFTVRTDEWPNGPHELHADTGASHAEHRFVVFDNVISDIHFDSMFDVAPETTVTARDSAGNSDQNPAVILLAQTRFVSLPVFKYRSPAYLPTDVHITARLPRAERWRILIRGEAPLVIRTLSGTSSRIDTRWDGTDAMGHVVARGGYYFRIFAGGRSSSLKLTSKFK